MGYSTPTPIWNPTTVLKIINTDSGYDTITCVGYAASRHRRCRKAIRADNRSEIKAILREISMLKPESRSVAAKLKTVASLGLCLQFHQGQVESVVEGWMRAVRDLGRKARIGDGGRGRRREIVIESESEEEDSESESESEEDQEPEFSSDGEDESTDCESEDSSDFESDNDKYARMFREIMEKIAEEKRAHEERKRQQRTTRVKIPRAETISKEQFRQKSTRLRLEEAGEQKKKKAQQKRVEKENKAREERRRKEEEEEQQRRQEKQREEEQQRQDEKAEKAAHAERIRQKAQKARETKQREASERMRKERDEWDQIWSRYQTSWENFKSCPSTKELRYAIPWPVKSGLLKDVNETNVKVFMTTAGPRDMDILRLMRQENLKWHSDKLNKFPRFAELTDVDRVMINMICLEVTDLINEAKKK